MALHPTDLLALDLAQFCGRTLCLQLLEHQTLLFDRGLAETIQKRLDNVLIGAYVVLLDLCE